jgi:SAM-dependent methyltransferase
MSNVSRAQRVGSFGRVVDDYERGRPRYPDEAVRWLVGDARRVADVGAGTGKLTSSLAKLAPEVAAIEPQHSMLVRLKEVVVGAYSVCAQAEALPIDSSWAEVVVVGQAFHWFDQQRAVPEIARVLKPGGHLALVWNVRDESVDWVAELTRITGSDNSQETRSRLKRMSHFGDFEMRSFRTVHFLDRHALVAHVQSRSHVAVLDEADRRRVMEAVMRLRDRHPDLAGQDPIEFPYRTEAYRVARKDLRGPTLV